MQGWNYLFAKIRKLVGTFKVVMVIVINYISNPQYIKMKRLFYLLILSGLLASCSGNESDQDAANNKPLDQSQALIHQFKPVIHGVWVKKNYIKKLIKKKSPMAAAERAVGITTMYIDTAKLKGDSIPVPAGWNNHKGSTVTLRFQPGKNTTTIELGTDELSYTIKNGDTTLIIYHYDRDTKETSSAKYIRAMNTQPAGQIGYAMNYMINHGIIAGKYQATDSKGKVSIVKFTDDGKVEGLPGLSTYFIQNDLSAGPKNNFDEVIFNLNGSGQTSYAFTINGKNISLYNISAGTPSNLKYKLIRKR
jgi:hypothetical protein